jgi:hypothetical protein
MEKKKKGNKTKNRITGEPWTDILVLELHCVRLQGGAASGYLPADFYQKAFPPVAQPEALKSAASPPLGSSPFGNGALKMQVCVCALQAACCLWPCGVTCLQADAAAC